MHPFARHGVSLLAMGLLSTSIATSLPLTSHADLMMPACQHEQGYINTSGQGEVVVKPDSLQFTVSVQATDDDLDDTRKVINQQMNQVVQALKATKTPHLTLKTQSLNIHPVYSAYEKNKLRKKIGYQANYTLQVQVTNTAHDQLGTIGANLLDTALNTGAEGSGGIQFYVDDLSDARQQALKNAVMDAKNNATIMATAAGISLGPVFSIDGSPQYGGGNPHPVPMMRAMAFDKAESSAGSSPIEAGEVTISSHVNIRYKLPH